MKHLIKKLSSKSQKRKRVKNKNKNLSSQQNEESCSKSYATENEAVKLDTTLSNDKTMDGKNCNKEIVEPNCGQKNKTKFEIHSTPTRFNNNLNVLKVADYKNKKNSYSKKIKDTSLINQQNQKDFPKINVAENDTMSLVTTSSNNKVVQESNDKKVTELNLKLENETNFAICPNRARNNLKANQISVEYFKMIGKSKIIKINKNLCDQKNEKHLKHNIIRKDSMKKTSFNDKVTHYDNNENISELSQELKIEKISKNYQSHMINNINFHNKFDRKCKINDNSKKNKTNFNEQNERYFLENNITGNDAMELDTTASNDKFVKEIDKNIFNLPNDFSLAHCVAEDLRMGAGIAVEFKQIFCGIGELIDQNLKVGDVGIVTRDNQTVFYLITKKKSNGKPTMMVLKKVLQKLVIKMNELNLTKLGIPKLGCGLDRLNWSKVKPLIENIFAGSGIHITVCIPSEKLDIRAPQPLNVFISPNNIWAMQSKTDIVLLIDWEKMYDDNWMDDILDKVNNKYPFKKKFLIDIKHHKFNPGDITFYNVNNENIFCIFINNSQFYSSVEHAFSKINSGKNTKYYGYLAMEYNFNDSENHLMHMEWIVLIFRSVFKYCELWLCGHDKLKEPIGYENYCRNMCNLDISRRFSSPNQFNCKLCDDDNRIKEKND